MTTITKLLQDVKTQAVNAGNGALSQTELQSIGNDLRARYNELLGLANTTDGNGQFLYSGFQGSTRPFTETAPGVVAYLGDQGVRLTQITPSRQVPVSDDGSDLFQKIKNGNGTFATAAAAANTGTGIISPGEVTNINAWNGATNPRDFSINFHVNNTVNPPVTTYDIVNNVTRQFAVDGCRGGCRAVSAHLHRWRIHPAAPTGSAGYQSDQLRLRGSVLRQGRTRHRRFV